MHSDSLKTLANVITNQLLTCFLSHPFLLHVIILCNCFVNKFGILELLFYVCILGTNVVASESLQKQHKPPLSGLGKRDAGCIEYMTAYDKQLIDFTTIFYTKEYSSSWEQDEEALPHQSLLIDGDSIINDKKTTLCSKYEYHHKEQYRASRNIGILHRSHFLSFIHRFIALDNST